jgi:hypothetical protein
MLNSILDGERQEFTHKQAEALLLACGAISAASHLPAFFIGAKAANEAVGVYFELRGEEPDPIEQLKLEQQLRGFCRGFLSAEDTLAEIEAERSPRTAEYAQVN